MTIIESLVNYFSSCPIIASLTNDVKVDFLNEKGKSFSIEPVAVNPVVSNYIGGGGERRYDFSIAVKFNYSDEARMNLDNSGFFEKLEEWLEKQNIDGNLPKLGEGKEAESIDVLSNGYLFGITPDMKYGRYEVRCRLLYEIE
ncbi:MAG: hypothetical protein IJH31_01805 [Erysipelotrichaceae bacterium]|nr:hypothetical protein [Erysipelotrichaceae bacterium]